MLKHSEGITKRYKFDCEKKFHMKIAREEDGTFDLRLPGERNGTCVAAWSEFSAGLTNRGLKRKLTPEDIVEIALGIRCEHCRPGYKSCIDKMARDMKETIESEKTKEI